MTNDAIASLVPTPHDLVREAHIATTGTITKLLITLLGFIGFCVLTLATPDSVLVSEVAAGKSDATIELPFAGQKVSFLAFLMLGPVFLLLLRGYIYFHVNHIITLNNKIETCKIITRPTLSHFDHPVLRIAVYILLYLSVPLTMLFFTWKAWPIAEFRDWLIPATAIVIAVHILLSLQRYSLQRTIFRYVSYGAAFIAVVTSSVFFMQNPNWIPRTLDLERADLSNQTLHQANFRGANLQYAKLRGTKLTDADLSNANLSEADLTGATLDEVNFEGAFLKNADLSKATLFSAENLSCQRLKWARNWDKAYRDRELACDKPRPSIPP